MYLFLDFDGVIHPVGSEQSTYFCRLPMLEEFLMNEAPDWRVVISSSWREYFSLEAIRTFFSPVMRDRVVGCTPVSEDRSIPATWGGQASLYPREVEIRHYLLRHCLPPNDWVALDDHAQWFRDPASNGHLVITNPAIGLTGDDIASLRRIHLHGVVGQRLLI